MNRDLHVFAGEHHSETFKSKPPLDSPLVNVYKYANHISRPFPPSSKCFKLYPSPGKPSGRCDFIPFCGETLEGTEILA